MFGALLCDTITVEPYLHEGADGWRREAVYGPPVPYSCRVEWEQRRVVDSKGSIRLSVGRVILPGVVAVSLRDRLSLPASCSPRTPGILAVEQQSDPFNLVASTVLHF